MKIFAILSIIFVNGFAAHALMIEESKAPGVTSRCISYPGTAPICTENTTLKPLPKESVAH